MQRQASSAGAKRRQNCVSIYGTICCWKNRMLECAAVGRDIGFLQRGMDASDCFGACRICKKTMSPIRRRACRICEGSFHQTFRKNIPLHLYASAIFGPIVVEWNFLFGYGGTGRICRTECFRQGNAGTASKRTVSVLLLPRAGRRESGSVRQVFGADADGTVGA